jgi:hypothetical protein
MSEDRDVPVSEMREAATSGLFAGIAAAIMNETILVESPTTTDE